MKTLETETANELAEVVPGLTEIETQRRSTIDELKAAERVFSEEGPLLEEEIKSAGLAVTEALNQLKAAKDRYPIKAKEIDEHRNRAHDHLRRTAPACIARWEDSLKQDWRATELQIGDAMHTGRTVQRDILIARRDRIRQLLEPSALDQLRFNYATEADAMERIRELLQMLPAIGGDAQ